MPGAIDRHDLSEHGGGRLILKPAARRGRWPDDDALFLSPGRGLVRYAFASGQAPTPHTVSEHEFDPGADLALRITRWVEAWNALAFELPPRYSPLHCREFDIQNHNREALAICRALVPLLPAGQQLCFAAGKRKGACHATWLREWRSPQPTGPAPSYYAADRDPDRWVRVMGDYGSCGLWEWSGAGVSPDFLAISSALKERIDRWASGYFSANDSWEPSQADDFARIQQDDARLRGYADEGLAIARAIKGELPDWTVVYFDEDLAGRHPDRAVFQFEIG